MPSTVALLQARAAAKDEKGNEAPQQAPTSTPQADIVVVIPAEVASKRAAASAADELLLKAKKPKLSATMSTAQETPEEAGHEADNGDATDEKAAVSKQKLEKIKWKKLATQVLTQSEGCMKFSKLQKELRLTAQVSKALTAEADALIASRLKGSSQFVVKGKMVSMAAAI